ncbi:hypothetical protein GDO86_013679 [Hymenochirus boettgeri]|uniref:Enolase 4 n=1 Tax=Hymenochirus boettgeri TaxID=247094 RepID=A0A8T2ISC5_9PIPI|nr:hypothetical protein GDO86_013679 [Hymenochirus boettgeri]
MSCQREARERDELKQAATEFYRIRQVPERLEEALNCTFFLGPQDVYGHLANYFAQYSETPVISSVRGRKVLDGVGKVTVEAEVLCTVKNINKLICSSVIPCGLLDKVSPDAPDENEQVNCQSVEMAIQWIRDLSPVLKGVSPSDQHKVDQILSDFYKPKMEEAKEKMEMERELTPLPDQPAPSPKPSPLPGKKKGSSKGKKASVVEKPIPPAEPPEPSVQGSIAIGALSLAVANASAILTETPLYLHIAALRNKQKPTEFFMPTPMITLLNYGKCSPGKLNLMKEVLVIPQVGLSVHQSLEMVLTLQKQIFKQLDSISKTGTVMKNVSPLGSLLLGGDRIEQPLDLISEACHHTGLELGKNLYLAINCAAHELMDYNKGKYETISGTFKSPDEMVDLYVDLINRHPAILALLDPLRKEDSVQWESLCNTLGSKCYILSEAAAKPVSELSESGTISHPTCMGVVIKHTNETTISQMMDVFIHGEAEKRADVFGCAYEESDGDSPADLAVGFGAQFIKLGGLLRGERTTKYNRLLAIEDELTQAGQLVFRTKYEFPILCNDSQTLGGPEETHGHS